MAEYRPIQIGDAVIGGPLGSRTGLLVGSIFYDKHSIVHDAYTGDFDDVRAKGLLEKVNSLSHRYGVQMAIDVIAAAPAAMARITSTAH